jgi:HEAT repeat protein
VEAILPATRFLYHADPDVRHAVVLALSGHDDHVAIYSLIALTSDPSEHVRDWATFALGTLLETDSPEIRHALISRLVDSDNDTRAEALVGLARRGDRTVVPALEKELASDEVGCRVFDAVEIIGDPDLVKRAADFQRRLVH